MAQLIFWGDLEGENSNPRSVRGLKPWFSLPGIQVLGPLFLQKFQRFLRFAPLQFAFCSELRPGLVTPELLASVIDKIAAAASVTGWTLHDSGVRFLFGWILLGFYKGSYCMQICICLTTVCAYLFMTTILLYSFCGHSSSCLVSF